MKQNGQPKPPCDPRDEELAGAYGGQPSTPEQAALSRSIVTFTRFDLVAPTPLHPIIDGYLFGDTLAAMVGASGSCKSFLALDMAASIATGTPWQGCDVDQGTVFYLGGEGQGGVRKRLMGWAQHHGIELARAPLYLSNCLPALQDMGNTAAVIATIEAMQRVAGTPRLLVIDTYARAMAGADENSAADVGRIVQGLDWMRAAWKCCVLVVHHTGHGENSRLRARGSSALYAALDSEMVVHSEGGPVTVKTTKAKDWEPAADLHLDRLVVDLDIDGQPETTLVLIAGKPLAGTSAAEQRSEVSRLKREGKTVREIATSTGLSKSAVGRHLKALELDAQSYRGASDGG